MLIIEHLENIVKEINETLKGSYLNRIESFNDYDYVFRFSRSKAPAIFITLNVKNPFVSLIKTKFNFGTITPFYTRLKTKLLNSCLIRASTFNGDNILKLDFIKTTDTYDKIHYSLIFEIFKSNGNLILLNENIIEDAFRFKGIDTHHPILRNMIYEAPNKVSSSKELLEKDIITQQKYIDSIEQNYLSSKYKMVKVELKRKLKSLNKKLEKIKEDKEEATKKLEYRNYADYFLTIMNDVNRGDDSFDYFGTKVKINVTYSPSENLNQLYKIYKKAKLTIISTEEYIQKSEDEISYIESVLATLDYLNENDYEELISELIDKKLIKTKGPHKIKNLKNAQMPYFVVHDNVRIGFGKNSKQNSTLTFSYANKDDYFLHIKNSHGNHVIIFESNPSDEVIKFALQFCVYLAKKNDAEVIFAKVRTIKKGKDEGLVKLSQYESYTIKNFDYDFDEVIKTATRF